MAQTQDDADAGSHRLRAIGMTNTYLYSGLPTPVPCEADTSYVPNTTETNSVSKYSGTSLHLAVRDT